MDIINKHIKKLNSICNKHHVKRFYVFGSVAENAMKQKSDIDFLVEFDTVNPSDYFDNYLSFKTALQKIFKREIDLVEKQTLKNPVLIKSINKTMKLIYERKDSEMAV